MTDETLTGGEAAGTPDITSSDTESGTRPAARRRRSTRATAAPTEIPSPTAGTDAPEGAAADTSRAAGEDAPGAASAKTARLNDFDNLLRRVLGEAGAQCFVAVKRDVLFNAFGVNHTAVAQCNALLLFIKTNIVKRHLDFARIFLVQQAIDDAAL